MSLQIYFSVLVPSGLILLLPTYVPTYVPTYLPTYLQLLLFISDAKTKFISHCNNFHQKDLRHTLVGTVVC